MNRRDFLKKSGLVVCGLSSLGAVGQTIARKNSVGTNTLFGKDVIDGCEKWLRQQQQVEPVIIDGKKYYVMLLHPQQEYTLRVVAARDKYKHEQWVIRYNKWRANRGESPYQEIEGEIGAFENVKFREEVPAMT